ncbi:hypothetical protein MTO96_034849, partial [Rhipicephalus appendiculatus]
SLEPWEEVVATHSYPFRSLCLCRCPWDSQGGGNQAGTHRYHLTSTAGASQPTTASLSCYPKTRNRADGLLETPAPLETPPPPPLVLPFSVQDAATEAVPSVEVQKIPDLAESPESILEKPAESPEEEEETMTGTFRVAVPFCDRCCCYSLVLLLLGSIMAINLAFLIAPDEVTNFFCELGIGENASKQARLPSKATTSLYHAALGLDTIEQPSLTHSTGEVTLPEFVKPGFTARERCSPGNCTLTEQKELAMERGIRRFTKPIASSPPYLEAVHLFDTVWYALPTIDRRSEQDDQPGSFLDRAMLGHLSARRTIWLTPTSTSEVATTQDLFRHIPQRYGLGESSPTARSTAAKRRVSSRQARRHDGAGLQR